MVNELALKLTVEAQEAKAEDMIYVGHCVIPLDNLIAQSFGWDYKPRSILATHAFDLARN